MSTNETEEALNNSIYKCSTKLAEKGYFYSDDGLYCPLEKDMYLKIGRTDKKIYLFNSTV